MPRPKKSNRKDGRYEIKRIVGYDAEGRAIKKSFYGSSKDDALQHYLNYISEAEKKQAEKKRMDFASWAEQWLYVYKEPDVKPTTFLTTYLRPCKNYIVPFFKDYTIQDISQVDIKNFLNDMSKNLSQSYIDKIVICLKGIFESAIDNDIIAKNPCRNISCKSKLESKQKRTYDKESVDKLCNSEHQYALLINILLRLGLRCSELCGLRWEDVDFEEGYLHIRRALTTEGGQIYIGETKSTNSTRRLSVPLDLLERMRANQGEQDEYIASINGRHITPDHFNERQLEVFYNSLRVPKAQRLSAHELRHTCGTLLYEETKDIYFVSRFLGHSDISITTKTYVHSEMQQDKIHITFDSEKAD